MNISIVPRRLPSNKNFLNLTGKRFTRLVVVAYAGRIDSVSGNSASHYWWCRCNCGNFRRVAQQSLTQGNTLSCGCFYRDRRKVLKHGMTNTPEYTAWSRIWQDCTNKKRKKFHLYGGRGIKVCNRWKDFDAFFDDMGMRPGSKYSIDRIDPDGDYEPGNCRWVTILTQGNNRRNNRKLKVKGKTMTVAQWSIKTGLNAAVICSRIDRHGWTAEQAVMTPRKGKGGKQIRYLTAFGETLSLAEWSRRTGIGESTIRWRIDNRGWNIERALSAYNRC